MKSGSKKLNSGWTQACVALPLAAVLAACGGGGSTDGATSTTYNPGSVYQVGTTAFDPDLLQLDEVVLPVQINGKKRAELTIGRDADQDSVREAVLALDTVKSALNGQAPKKIIVVPLRIVNIVV